MYEAINSYIIVRKPQERVSASGIILTEERESQVFEMEVVATNETTKSLQGRFVYCQPRHCTELGKDDTGRYGAVDVKDIVAIKA